MSFLKLESIPAIDRDAINVIIETPKAQPSKFKYDPEHGIFRLEKLLPLGTVFPFDFGFLPSTLGEDGDPLDILVLMDAPAHVGCLIEVRIIGIINAEQTEDGKTESNDRLLGGQSPSAYYWPPV